MEGSIDSGLRWQREKEEGKAHKRYVIVDSAVGNTSMNAPALWAAQEMPLRIISLKDGRLGH